MFIEPVSTEMVYQAERKVLKDHFNLFYDILAESHLVDKATFDRENHRCLSGLQDPYYNAVFGCLDIEKQLEFFNKMPFVWYLEEEVELDFKKDLIAQGFTDGGIFRGVVGTLDKPIPTPIISDDYILELIEEEAALEEFNELVCSVFGIQDKRLHQKFLWNAMKNQKHPMFHWVARKGGRVVSALSTLIEGDVVSFWNGASLLEIRCQGVSTALRCFALQDAVLKGCHVFTSYLMSDGLASGICSKLGAESRWQFHVFLSPGS